jgi:hypothetical protein
VTRTARGDRWFVTVSHSSKHTSHGSSAVHQPMLQTPPFITVTYVHWAMIPITIVGFTGHLSINSSTYWSLEIIVGTVGACRSRFNALNHSGGNDPNKLESSIGHLSSINSAFGGFDAQFFRFSFIGCQRYCTHKSRPVVFTRWMRSFGFALEALNQVECH